MSYLQRYNAFIVIILLLIGLFLIFGLNFILDENEENSTLINFIGQICIIISATIYITNRKTDDIIITDKPIILETIDIKPNEIRKRNKRKEEIEERLIEIGKFIKDNQNVYLAHTYNPNEQVYNAVKQHIEEKNKLIAEFNLIK